MKYIIANSRLENIILRYLDSNLTPYDGWNPEEYYEDARAGLDGLYLFLDEDNTDEHMYYLTKKSNKNFPKVFLPDYWYDSLMDLFGEHWKPVFIKWFEKNTTLPIKSVDGTSF